MFELFFLVFTSHSLSHRRINWIIRYYLEICSRRFTTTTTTCTIFSSLYFPSRRRRLSKGKQQQLLQNMTQFEWNRRRRIVNYYTKAKFFLHSFILRKKNGRYINKSNLGLIVFWRKTKNVWVLAGFFILLISCCVKQLQSLILTLYTR